MLKLWHKEETVSRCRLVFEVRTYSPPRRRKVRSTPFPPVAKTALDPLLLLSPQSRWPCGDPGGGCNACRRPARPFGAHLGSKKDFFRRICRRENVEFRFFRQAEPPDGKSGGFCCVSGEISRLQHMGFRSGETIRVASVAAWICSTVNSGLYSVSTSPLSVTSITPISVMIRLTQWTAV